MTKKKLQMHATRDTERQIYFSSPLTIQKYLSTGITEYTYSLSNGFFPVKSVKPVKKSKEIPILTNFQVHH